VRITYLLASTELNGGHKVAFQHARLLRERGHDATVLAPAPAPEWSPPDVPFVTLGEGAPPLPPQDLVVGTYWTTLPLARRLALGPVAHFCQGFEGDLEHLQPQRAAIEEVYRWPLPTLTVSAHLVTLLAQRFGREARVAPPPLDPLFVPAARERPQQPPWIAVPGIFEAEVKGVRTALAAVARLRARGTVCPVLRMSILPLSAAERDLLVPECYLCGAPPAVVAAALRDCALLLLPSRPAEGFGLPLLEAMASGVPAVATRIPSVIAMAGDAVPLVAVDDDLAMSEAAAALLGDDAAWRAARKRGLVTAARFAPDVVAAALDAAVCWAARAAATTPTV
jgi:glycosyltransferase involved in cell wall biosynthesis